MRSKVVLVFLLLSINAPASQHGHAKDDIAKKAASCAAYFTALSKMPGTTSDHRERSQDFKAQSYVLSAKLSNRGLAEVRVNLALAEIIETLDKATVNWTAIIDPYDAECKSLLDEYKDRIRFWRIEHINEPRELRGVSEYRNA